jgi:helix-hairpin-helix protein
MQLHKDRFIRILMLLAVILAFVSPTLTYAQKKSSKAETAKGTKQTNSRIDLNTASKEELDALPGIGGAYAQKIIDGRPYKSKSDLVRKGVIPSSTYDKIKDQISARQTAKSGGSEATQPDSHAATPGKPSAGQPDKFSTKTETDDLANSAQEPPQKGMVWVNLNSGIYHREGDRWYGKTKNGRFMSEADAQKAGYRATKSGEMKKD